MITYTGHASIGPEQAINLYTRSTLGERRPIDSVETFAAMLANSNLTISTWEGEKLIGISRSLTDFAYVAYLADLAVDEHYSNKRLIEETQKHLKPGYMIVLLAAPKANTYYEHLALSTIHALGP